MEDKDRGGLEDPLDVYILGSLQRCLVFGVFSCKLVFER